MRCVCGGWRKMTKPCISGHCLSACVRYTLHMYVYVQGRRSGFGYSFINFSEQLPFKCNVRVCFVLTSSRQKLWSCILNDWHFAVKRWRLWILCVYRYIHTYIYKYVCFSIVSIYVICRKHIHTYIIYIIQIFIYGWWIQRFAFRFQVHLWIFFLVNFRKYKNFLNIVCLSRQYIIVKYCIYN